MSRIIGTLVVWAAVAVQAQTVINDASINAGETLTLTSGSTYMLDGFVFVEEGATIVIEPGVVVKGLAAPTTGDNSSALIIARGGMIMAQGTAAQPIIFTAESDDVSNPSDLTWSDRGLWGGIIILGRATTNRGVEGQIEGIPSGEARAAYGGDNDSDNSGVLRYVSIRHGGAELGPGDEINGLTLGAVGSGTTIEHVEIFANLDDGVEWFGGTVNTKWLAIAFCGDDSADWDEGWRGNNQFWFAIQGTDNAGRIGEHDGGTIQETAEPYSLPTISNATYIGPGINAFPQGDGSEAIIFRDNSGGSYVNSIITEYNGANDGKGISVEDLESGDDSRVRLEAGQLVLANNIWWQFGNGNTLADIAPQDFVAAHLAANVNAIADPQLNSVSRINDGSLDPRPSTGGPAAAGAQIPGNPFFTAVGYLGAFAPDGPTWLEGWTALSQTGHLLRTSETVVLTDESINAGETLQLTANNEYLLDGFVFVEDGATLIIEAGTVIKGKQTPSNSDNASALIVARGGQIQANGTAQNPIIFTAESDDVQNPNDLTWSDRGLWGGLILLGRATTNRGVEGQIEGIPSGEARAAYGGDDDTDNSGVLRYVSIRHGGAELGPGDEINGLTLGAVGSGTIIEHVEIYANLDDGVEWFGGTVNTKWLVMAFCGDDSADWDEGWRGKNQFWFAIQGTDNAGRIGEHDGGTIQETAEPYSTPQISHATYIGPGINAFPQGDGSEAIIFRDNSGGTYVNSIITEYNGANDGKGISVEDLESGDDSRVRLENGDLKMVNNLWWQFGNGNTIEAIAPQSFVADHLVANSNTIANPLLGGVSRVANGGLDPRPSSSGPAAMGAFPLQDTFFMNEPYRGAFEPGSPLWIAGWTALSQNGHLGFFTTVPGDRLLGHITRPDGGFRTELRMLNQGQSAAQVTLQPYLADGSAMAPMTMDVPGDDYSRVLTSDLFGNEPVSHIEVTANNDVIVTASYRVNGSGASAELNESVRKANLFRIYQGESDLVFDGLALVNRGDSPATVTVTQWSTGGTVLATTTLTSDLGPNQKMLQVLGDVLMDEPGSVIEVRSSEPSEAVFLRGTPPGVSPGYLYVVVPVFVE